MQQKKVIFISHWYPTTEHPSAGIFIKKHANAISQIADITIVHFNLFQTKKIFSVKLIKKGANEFEIYVESIFYKLLYYFIPFQFFLFKRLIKKFHIDMHTFDMVHSNVIFPSGIVGHKISKKYQIKQIHSEHWSRFSSFLNHSFYKKSALSALKNMDRIFPVSKLLEKEIQNYVNPTITKVIPNIVDSLNFPFKEKEKKSRIKFLCVAYLQKPKNPFFFLDALENLYTQNNLDFELIQIGKGNLIPDIKAKNYSFPIQYLGKKSPEKIADYFHESDFFLLGSEYETFSIVIVESLYTGTPVLVSNVGIAPELIDETNGFICENNSKDWYKKIQLALERNYNHAEIAKKVKGRYDSRTVSLLFQEIYSQIQ